jgi:hypothetical protein
MYGQILEGLTKRCRTTRQRLEEKEVGRTVKKEKISKTQEISP